jgi:hypothetical protein
MSVNLPASEHEISEFNNIEKKLRYVQYNLIANKTQYNSFGKYNYRSCEDILEAVKPLLNEVSAVITLGDSIENVGDRYYIKATATITDIETKESISVAAYAREAKEKKGMDESQLTGATSSYARKYALNGLLLIDDSKDSDFTNTGEEPKPKAKQASPKPTAPREELIALLNEKGIDIKEYSKEKGLNKETTDSEFKALICELKAK